MPSPKGWITARDAADVLGVTIQRVHQLVASYGIESMEVNPRFKLLKESDVHKIASKERPNGVHIGRAS